MLRLRRLLSRSRRRVARYHVLRGIQWGLAIGILVSLAMVLYQFGLIVLDEELEFKSSENTNHTNVTRDDYSTTNWNYIAVKEVITIPDFDEITDAAFPDSNTSLQIFPLKREPPIVIGLVSCDRIGEYKSAFLATTMIKSVLVSAEIYGVSQVEFHIFIEADTSGYFMSRLQDFGYAKKDRKNRVHVRVNCHPILDAIPENFQKEFLYSRKKAHWRGGFARLLYATNLPAVDSIIHLDTDIIITGDITQLWSFLGKMDDGRMLAVAPAAEPDEKFFDKLYQYHFADIPHVKPWGLNTGVLVMNLTRMRRDGWDKIVFDTYDYYSKRFDLRNSDGRIMNIILANHRDIFIFLTCQFNYEYIHCDNGQNCKHALEDPNGIQLVHGAGFQFQKKRASLHKVFEFFEQYDMAHEDVRKSLMIPLREHYGLHAEGRKSWCYGSLNKLLFKNFFA